MQDVDEERPWVAGDHDEADVNPELSPLPGADLHLHALRQLATCNAEKGRTTGSARRPPAARRGREYHCAWAIQRIGPGVAEQLLRAAVPPDDALPMVDDEHRVSAIAEPVEPTRLISRMSLHARRAPGLVPSVEDDSLASVAAARRICAV